MEDLVLAVVLVPEQPGEFPRVSVDHSEIQRSKVLVEGEVSQIVIDIEEECILEVLWWFDVRNPVKLV